MKQNIAFAVVAVAILAGGWYFVSRNGAVNPAGNTNQPTSQMDGLKIEDLAVGSGTEVKRGDTVTVNYVGTLDNGAKFDSSYDRGEPITFSLNQVIKGWQEGIPGMKVGGKRRLTIAPELGYGANAVGSIPPNSTLHFDVELLGVGGGQ